MSNAQKTPLVQTLSSAARGSAADLLALLGKALPASVVSVQGAIITINFEIQDQVFSTLPQVTVPLFGPEYVRYPIQPGDKGVVFAADAYLGGMSGLGGGVAGLVQLENLTNLVFFPIGNMNFTPVDAQSVTLYGPNGVVLRDAGSAVTFTLTPSGIAIKGDVMITGNLSVMGNITATGNISLNGSLSATGAITSTADITAGGGSISLLKHTHMAGTSTTSPPIAGT